MMGMCWVTSECATVFVMPDSGCVARPRTCPLIMKRLSAVLLVILAIWMVGLVGCGKDKMIGRVFGKVTFQGQPVSEGLILFVDREQGIHMSAKIGPDGSYELKLAEDYGLPVGTYRVLVTPPLIEGSEIGPLGPRPKTVIYDNLPTKYRNQQTSGLSLIVKEGDNPFDVDMTP